MVLILFWAIYFVDPFLEAVNSVEAVRNFESFNLRDGRGEAGKVSYTKWVTEMRHFTVYSRESDFHITDTVELKVTPIFGLVKKYRDYERLEAPKAWIISRYSPYRRWTALIISLGLLLLCISSTFIIKDVKTLQWASLFTIAGTIIFILSTLL